MEPLHDSHRVLQDADSLTTSALAGDSSTSALAGDSLVEVDYRQDGFHWDGLEQILDNDKDCAVAGDVHSEVEGC